MQTYLVSLNSNNKRIKFGISEIALNKKTVLWSISGYFCKLLVLLTDSTHEFAKQNETPRLV